ncbi:hypothetical protein CAPTEDRAFT_214268 [Capitella teleta]|uniref:Uncharacterized protein n=1 Tax=Capitella teleta TaxID=283909 RepID=R7VK94_CAPTE|nr:hypothetical protein CAPTEDRAFT_214268 [Capitella teleta]|eukprot:ELU17146.1 hypothetical protein CAPTEDRAFT_214268 [Capitella teleta]
MGQFLATINEVTGDQGQASSTPIGENREAHHPSPERSSVLERKNISEKAKWNSLVCDTVLSSIPQNLVPRPGNNSANPEGLAKARSGARRWASRTSNRLTEVLSAPGSGVDDGARLKNKEIAVRDAIQELEKRITALDAAQEKYELEEQLDADIEGSSVLRETQREPLVSATAWLSSQQEEPRGMSKAQKAESRILRVLRMLRRAR